MSSVPRPALAVGVLALAVGAGYGAAKLTGPSSAQIEAAMQHLSAASADLRGGQEGALRLGTELKALKTSVDTLRGERDRTRGELLAKQERTEKVTSDSATRLGKLADQLERMEKTQRDPARINAVLERIERLEGKLQVAQTAPTSAAVATAAPTPPPKPVAQAVEPAQTGSLPEPKVAAAKPDTDTRRVQLDGYVLRDVDDGMALIEGRNGRFYEVAPGMNLPGIGKVEALERRGRHWVVLTPKGYIGER